jgi:hypothetical protein
MEGRQRADKATGELLWGLDLVALGGKDGAEVWHVRMVGEPKGISTRGASAWARRAPDLSTYEHVIDELDDSPQIPAEDAIRAARGDRCVTGVTRATGP